MESLVRTPDNVSQLAGLERVLRRLDQLDSIRRYVTAAVQASPRDPAIRELQFRMAAALDGSDSVAVVAAQWIVTDSTSDMPYRLWAQWLAEQGNVDGARVVIEQGQARLGDRRLSPQSAAYAAMAGDWPDAARQWVATVADDPSLLVLASGSLRRAPQGAREELLNALGDGSPTGEWISAFLMAAWDRAEEAWTALDHALPSNDAVAATLLRQFADRAAELGTPEALRSRGYALERLAEMSVGRAAERARLDAARAFADAGNLAGAQRMLDRLTITADTNSREAATAMATFIQVLSEAGRVAEAEERFREWESRMSSRDVSAVKENLAWGWVRAGELDRAEAVLSEEWSVGAQAIRGWVALYRGDLSEAQDRFQEAGPYTRSRTEATSRSRAMVMLERVRGGSLPELGAAMLLVAQGDTVRAVERMREAARLVPPGGGRAELLVHAAELAVAAADTGSAEGLLLEATEVEPEGPSAPAAELALATIYAATDRNEEALRRLEYLVLNFPGSAVVPQARRLLDQVRGVIPKT
jgi:tetratricopeptide (TPR) repeat protein